MPRLAPRATLRDVARKAGVAVSTVSGILNERADSWASRETRERVLEAVRSLNYKPNRFARGLRLKRFSVTTLIVPDLTNPLFAILARAFQRAMSQRGYELLVEETENSLEKETRILQEIAQHYTDGAIVVLADPKAHRNRLVELSQRLPVFLLGAELSGTGVDSLESDFGETLHEAILHLASLNHRRIGYVDSLADRSDPIDRLRVFRHFVTSAHIEFDDRWWIRCAHNLESVRAAVRDWVIGIGSDRRPTALFCTNDMTAIATLRGFLDCGVRVPEDVSLVGFDDVPLVSFLPLPITTIAQPVGPMAEHATERLIGRIEERITGPGSHARIPTHYVIRESTAQAPS